MYTIKLEMFKENNKTFKFAKHVSKQSVGSWIYDK